MSGLPELVADNVTVRFGGLTAVNDVSLQARAGSITGLIGPNGAGKTTIFNACTGFVSTTSGSVHLGEQRLDRHGPSARARMGLGRTFQRMELWDSMTVTENVELGPEGFGTGRRPWGQLFGSRQEQREIRARAHDALEQCGILHLAGRVAGDLSTGQRRLVELARAMASPFTFLLLDEPSSGLDHAETAEFGQILRDFVTTSEVGVLLVEHDMALVADVCGYIYVLDFGQLIYSGDTADALSNDLVRKAYLGDDDDALEAAATEGHSLEWSSDA